MKRKIPQTEDIKEIIKDSQKIHNMYGKYMNILTVYLNTVKLQEGKGIIKGRGIMKYFSPQELIKRFELLGGSLAAGNNGVLHDTFK